MLKRGSTANKISHWLIFHCDSLNVFLQHLHGKTYIWKFPPNTNVNTHAHTGHTEIGTHTHKISTIHTYLCRYMCYWQTFIAPFFMGDAMENFLYFNNLAKKK